MTQQIRRVESTVETPRYTVPASEPVLYTFVAAGLGAAFAGFCGVILDITGVEWWALVFGVGALTGYPVLLYTVWAHYELKRGQFQSRTTSEEYLMDAQETAEMAATVAGVTSMHTLSGIHIPKPEGGYLYVSPERVRDIASVVNALHGQLVEARLRHFNTNSYAELSRVMLAHKPPLMERAGNNVTMLTRAGYEVFGFPRPVDAGGGGVGG